MKILFVTGVLRNGGAERVVSVLANEFVGFGHEVAIAAVEGGSPEYKLDGHVAYYPNDVRPAGKLDRAISRISFLHNVHESVQPDCVISFCTEVNIYSIVSLWRRRSTLIISERNDPHQDPKGMVKRLLRSALYRFADGYIFQTEDAKSFFSSEIQKRGVVLPNPLKEGIPSRYDGVRTHRIVTVARLEDQKNLTLLLQAFNDFCINGFDHDLEIYGEGSQREMLMTLAQRLNMSERVHFMGFSAHVAEDIADASVFVLSSDYEGVPNALLEAMAGGVPCISTDCPVGGPRMYINDHENGILVPVDDRHALCAAMCEVAGSESLQELLSKNAAELRFRMQSSRVASMWLDEVQKMLR